MFVADNDADDATKGVDDTLFNIMKYISSGSMCDDIVTEFMALLFPASSVESWREDIT